MNLDERLSLPCGICGRHRREHIGRVFGCPRGYGTSWNPEGNPDPRLHRIIPQGLTIATAEEAGRKAYEEATKESTALDQAAIAWSRWRDRCNRRDARHAAIIRTLEFRPLCTCAETTDCPIHGARTHEPHS
jgi:hypothetical protein